MKYFFSVLYLLCVISCELLYARPNDSLTIPRVQLHVEECFIGRSVQVGVYVNRESGIDPQREILLSCRIGSNTEEQKRFVERDAIKERGRGTYWSKYFRFGYISAADTQVVVRVLWLRERDTIVIKTESIKPKLKLHPGQAIWNHFLNEKTVIVPQTRSQSIRCVVDITPQPRIPIDARPDPRGSRYPEIVYADFSKISISNQQGFIDYTTSSISLFVGETRDTTIKIRLTPENLRLIQILPGKDSTEIHAIVEFRGMPRQPDTTQIYSLRGVLALRYGYTIQGRPPAAPVELSPRRSYLKIYVPLLPGTHEQAKKPGQEFEPDFIQWLNQFISTTPLPPGLLQLKPVAQRGNLRLVLAHEDLINSLHSSMFTSMLTNAGRDIYALEQDCSESHRIKHCYYYLPIPESLIQQSGTVEDCEKYRSLLERQLRQRITHVLLFMEEGKTPPSKRLLYSIPVGFGVPLSLQNLVRLSVSSFNHFQSMIYTADSLRKNPLKPEKAEIYFSEPDARTPGITMAQFIDTLDYHRYHSLEALARIKTEQEIQRFIEWGRGNKTQPPYRIYEADSAARVRFQEAFFPAPQKTPALMNAEMECPASDDIKRLIAEGARVQREILDEAPNECMMTINFYKIFYEQKTPHRVLIFVQELTKDKPAVMFAVLTGSLRNREAEFVKTPLWQQLEPPARLMTLTGEELKRMLTRVADNTIPERGSINTVEKTMHDYLTTQRQHGKLQEITELFSRKRGKKP